jgi:hypothetical protein
MEVVALPSEEDLLPLTNCEAGRVLKSVRTFWRTEKHISLASAEVQIIR